MIATERKTERALEIFLRTIKRYGMIRKGDSFLVAVSGGPDSVTLFDLLYQIRADWQLDLHIVHLNHGLRGEASEKDQMFMERFAKDLKVPISLKRVDVAQVAWEKRLSVEEAGRECRLEFFRSEADRLGIHKVALGHHRDDRAETVLIRILRGTGLRGLGAMKPVAEWRGLTLVRPLIELEKRDVLDYVRDRKLAYCVDFSNQEARFLRNRIRNRLIPELERHYNPRIKSALANLAETVSMDLVFIEGLVLKQYGKVVRKKKDSLVILKRRKFLEQPEPLRFRILQKAVYECDPESELDYYHWDEIRKALEQNMNRYEIHVAHELSLALERKEIVLRRLSAERTQPYEYKMGLGEKVVAKEVGLEFVCEAFDQRVYKLDRRDKTSGIFDLERIRFPIIIRNRREGDMFRPLGLHYDRKLKDFLIARKVPSYDKDQVPLFSAGGEIFWVYAVEISDRFKVTNRTRRFLKITSRPV